MRFVNIFVLLRFRKVSRVGEVVFLGFVFGNRIIGGFYKEEGSSCSCCWFYFGFVYLLGEEVDVCIFWENWFSFRWCRVRFGILR